MTAEERRLLELLAASDDGSTEALLRALAFTDQTIADLMDAGLLTAKAESVLEAGRAVEVTRVRITEAGRLAAGG